MKRDIQIKAEDKSIIRYLYGDNALESTQNSIEFSYICNPDQTIRWIFPESLKSPMFLNFYSTSSLRSKILNFIIKSAYFFGLSNLVVSGTVKINIQKGSKLANILTKYKHSGFSIFTGTIGKNRKAVIEFHESKKVHVFVKIALTEAAKDLVNNEAESLKYMSTFNYNTLVIPKLLCDNKKDTIALSNIKPKTYKQSPILTSLHIKALSEVYNQFNDKLKWKELLNQKNSKVHTTNLINSCTTVNSLNVHQIHKLANNTLTLIDLIEENDEELTIATSHGDFTPWNMYHSKNMLYLFDWELSQKDTPLLFDSIHFIFQSQIMIKHTNYKRILNELKRLRELKCTRQLIQSYEVNFNKNYMYYLVYNITYYLNNYIKQKDLHEQVFWLIDIWEEAINDAIDKKGVIF